MTLTADLHTTITWENYLDTPFVLTCTNQHAIHEPRPAIIRLFFYYSFHISATSIFLYIYHQCQNSFHHGFIRCIMLSSATPLAETLLHFRGVFIFLPFFLFLFPCKSWNGNYVETSDQQSAPKWKGRAGFVGRRKQGLRVQVTVGRQWKLIGNKIWEGVLKSHQGHPSHSKTCQPQTRVQADLLYSR